MLEYDSYRRQECVGALAPCCEGGRRNTGEPWCASITDNPSAASHLNAETSGMCFKTQTHNPLINMIMTTLRRDQNCFYHGQSLSLVGLRYRLSVWIENCSCTPKCVCCNSCDWQLIEQLTFLSCILQSCLHLFARVSKHNITQVGYVSCFQCCE